MWIFRVNLGMSPLKSIVSEKQALFCGFKHTFMGFLQSYMGKCSFLSKPRHVTPQIDCLRKMSPVLRVSTHIYGVSKEIHEKMLIFQVNLGMWPLKSIVLEKQTLFWGFQHTFMGFLRRYMGKCLCSSKPRHVTPQINCLREMSPVLRVSTHIYEVSKEMDGKRLIFPHKHRHVTPQIDCLRKISPILRVSIDIYGVSKEIDGKTLIFQVNLGMSPLKSIVSEKQALFWGFQHTFIGFLRRYVGKCSFL